MRKRALVYVVLLAIVVVAAWWAWQGAHDEPTATIPPIDSRGDAARGPGLLEGGGARPPRPDTAPLAKEPVAAVGRSAGSASPSDVVLVVHDTADAPLPSAEVHGIAKRPVADESLHRIGGALANGRVTLDRRAVPGHWLVATAVGFVPQTLDGDRVDTTRDTVVRLEAGSVVEAIVTEADDRTRVAGARVSVEPRRDQDSDADPSTASGLSPRELDSLVRTSAETGEDGRAVLRVGTTGPVRVEARPSNWNFVVEPESIDLPRPSGVVRFRIVAGCRIVIRASDDSTSASLAVAFEVRYGPIDAPVERWAGGFTTNPEKTGVFDLTGFRPGRYRVRVRAEGYEDFLSDPVALERAGANAVVEARMKRAPVARRGTIRLTLRGPAHEGSPWYARGADDSKTPTVLLRRTSPDPTEWGGPAPRPPLGMSIDPDAIKAGETRYDADRRVVELRDLDPARYAAAVFDRSTWTVGGIADLEVLPDSVTERTVALAAGVRVAVADIAGDSTAVRGIRLFDEQGTEWPKVTLGFGRMTVFDAESRISAGVVLVPVPAERVRVTWKGDDGAEHETTLPAGAR